MHELTHAIYRTSDGKLILEKGVKNMPKSRKAEIRKKYASIGQGNAAVIIDETNAHYAEELLGNRNTLEMLFDETPTIKDKIISFFRGAKSAYANDTKLSRSASKLFNTYKKLFEEFSMRNQGNNDLSSSLRANSMKKTPVTNRNDKNMRVRGDNDQDALGVTNTDVDTDTRFALSYDDAIDKLENGTLDTTQNTHLRVLEHTPQIYIDKAGASDREIVMSWDIAYLAMNKNGSIPGNYHGLGADIMKALPVALEDPLYIVKQKNGRIAAVTKIVVKGKRAVFASIELDAYQTTIQEGEPKANKYNLVVTVTDAKPNYLQNTIFSGEIVHNKNSEDPAHFILRLKSLEKAVPTYDLARSSDNSIPENFEKSNSFSEKNEISEKTNKRNALPDDFDYAIPEGSNRRFALTGWTKDGYEVYETSREVKQMSKAERINKFIDDFGERFKDKTARLERNGETVHARFVGTRKALGKFAHEGPNGSDNAGYRAKMRLLADGDIISIVENSEYKSSGFDSGKEGKAHKYINRWDYFYKTVIVDGKGYDIIINVRNIVPKSNANTEQSFVYSMNFYENNDVDTNVAEEKSKVRYALDLYSETEYNNFGWARHADAISKSELDDLYSKIQERTILRTFKQSSKGEAIIEVNNKSHTTLGVDNVFVFVKGTKSNFSITRVVRFIAETETEMEIIKERLYERRSFSDTHLAYLEQQGFATQYTREGVKSFSEYKGLREDGETRRGTNPNNRGRAKYRSGYSLSVGEDGEITESNYISSENTNLKSSTLNSVSSRKRYAFNEEFNEESKSVNFDPEKIIERGVGYTQGRVASVKT